MLKGALNVTFIPATPMAIFPNAVSFAVMFHFPKFTELFAELFVQDSGHGSLVGP